MRILFVAPYVPSPIRVRPYQFIRHLARRGHRITLVALADGLPSTEALAELKAICAGGVHVVPHAKWRGAAQSLIALPTPIPLWSAYCRSPKMARLLQNLTSTNPFDVVHVEHIRAAHFVRSLNGLPTVFDAVDCITALRRQIVDRKGSAAQRALAWEEWVKLKRFEPRAYSPFQRVIATSQHDADALMRLAGETKTRMSAVSVVPNGVDLDYFHPGDVHPEPDTMVFSGKMSYHANDDAARYMVTEVLPLLRRRRPNVTLIVAGSEPTPALRALAERDPVGGLRITGYVDDLRPYLQQAQLAVCPMRIGVGIQNKALEAMAIGRPVVCSPLVSRALSGADALGALRVADTASPDAFASACAAFLENPTLAEAAGHSARRFVEENHSWDHATGLLEALYAEARGESTRL